MTIDMSTTRTDLALESVQAACSGAETGTISGVRSRERTREGYAVTDIRVEDEDGAQALGKPVGRYVTVDLGPYFRREADYFDRGVRCLAGELAALLPEDAEAQNRMIQGLVDSLCSLEDVTQVQLMLDGEYQLMLGSVPISRPILPTGGVQPTAE